MHPFATALLVVLPVPVPLQAPVPEEPGPGTAEPALPEADPAITIGELERHVAFLASDELAGREAGFPGAERAADHLERELERLGLEPLGVDGTFRLPLRAVRVDHRSAPRIRFRTNTGEQDEGVLGADFELVVRGELRSTEMLPIYRVSEQRHIVDEPREGEALLVRMRATNAELRAELRALDPERWGLELRTLDKVVERGNERIPDPEVTFGPPEPDGAEQVTVQGEMRETLLWLGYTHAQLVVDLDQREVPVHDLVARIPGTDPALADEVLLLQAPLDHVGEPLDRQRKDDADRVRNGANEASACAALLEIAGALAADPPARPVVVLFTTASPVGRYGLAAFLERPPVPLASIHLALSIERVGRIAGDDDRGRLLLHGARADATAEAFAAQDLAISAAKRTRPRLLGLLFREANVPSLLLAGTVPEGDVDPFTDNPETIDTEHLLGATLAAYGAARAIADGTVSLPE